MLRVTLSADDARETVDLITGLSERIGSVEEERFLQEATVLAQQLPRALRTAVNDLRMTESHGACVISGFPLDPADVDPTPAHWQDRLDAPVSPADVYFFLVATLLGDVVGWATQQGGRLMHDLVPIKGHEAEQLGSGSTHELVWHTEEAFHPFRADYLALMCLRNNDAVATTYASLDDIEPSRDEWEVLSRSCFTIRPDPSHLPRSQPDRRLPPAQAELLQRSLTRIVQMQENPVPMQILFGDPARPYLRIDPAFMVPTGNRECDEAVEQISAKLDTAMVGVALQPGELLIIDNYRVVHGRAAFQPRYDGTDRWLKRLNIVRDLRKSREARTGPAGRVIH